MDSVSKVRPVCRFIQRIGDTYWFGLYLNGGSRIRTKRVVVPVAQFWSRP